MLSPESHRLAPEEHHHHVLCVECGAAEDFSSPALADDRGKTPASQHISFIRDFDSWTLPMVLVVLLIWLIVTGTSNAVNLTDGLDGLAAGSSAMVFASYVFISFWQFTHDCANELIEGCYTVRDPLDVTLLAAAGLGACLGFLWWNTSPAWIFMGDTGSLALGGALGAIAILLKSEFLLLFICGVFVAETVSVILQRTVFKYRRRRYGLEYAKQHRVFRRAPLHHHFELAGWTEGQVVVRFWILGILCAFLAISTLKLR